MGAGGGDVELQYVPRTWRGSLPSIISEMMDENILETMYRVFKKISKIIKLLIFYLESLIDSTNRLTIIPLSRNAITSKNP